MYKRGSSIGFVSICRHSVDVKATKQRQKVMEFLTKITIIFIVACSTPNLALPNFANPAESQLPQQPQHDVKVSALPIEKFEENKINRFESDNKAKVGIKSTLSA